MKRRDLITLAIVAILIGGGLALWLAPEEGLRPAPEVSFQTLDGRTLSMEGLRGQPVLLTFWATNCPSCVREIPHLAELHERYQAQGLKVIGIAMSYDRRDHVEEMVRAREIPYTIAHDTNDAAALAFGQIRLTPTSFLISPQGRIVYQKLGDIDWSLVERNLERWLG
ncbi:peroxiredoxin family protein [Thioalkalivibrio sulfidiphilus]|uniref:Redoxin domain protein n=1 Tax=Thioalkalivibrio sulfidiphilus (strain HL-EbGR7) TaxID=396588 RepID=B8GLD5_THISH|nr:TlpA disulfide reductase family protein [Thioalkalivibrio sulfidiphilus]ACL73490.1 Redoxin domain protein [Thioalkalivibrio sulfidiphilus HL-EbGr7]